MAKKKVLTALILILGAVSLFFYLCSQSHDESRLQPGQKDESFLASKSAANKLPIKDESENKDCPQGTLSPIYKNTLRESKLNSKELDDIFVSGMGNPEPLLKDISNPNGLAAIAIFKIVRNCYSLRSLTQNSTGTSAELLKPNWPTCPLLPSDIVQDPLSVLKNVANKGSADAMLVYAQNGETIASFYRQQNDGDSVSIAREIVKETEVYGKKAAEEGLSDAFAFMSIAYEKGRFGPPDLESAYTYGLPLKDNSKYELINQNMKKILPRISPAQTSSAYARAFGCARKASPELLRNPFTENRD